MHCHSTSRPVKVCKTSLTAYHHTELLRTLAYKSIDLEARSRRNNLIVRGVIENRGENCFQIIRDLLRNRLDIDPQDIYIARSHRLGKPNWNKDVQRRPIIVNYRDYCDTELIMSRVRMLKGTNLSIDFDFPREIQVARSRLWPRYKQLKHDSPNSKIQLVYPAKLIQDGRLIEDAFPDWGKYTNSNRLPIIPGMEDEASSTVQNHIITTDMNTVGKHFMHPHTQMPVMNQFVPNNATSPMEAQSINCANPIQGHTIVPTIQSTPSVPPFINMSPSIGNPLHVWSQSLNVPSTTNTPHGNDTPQYTSHTLQCPPPCSTEVTRQIFDAMHQRIAQICSYRDR